MTDTKLSILPAATALGTGDQLVIVQGGTTKRIDASLIRQIADHVLTSSTITDDAVITIFDPVAGTMATITAANLQAYAINNVDIGNVPVVLANTNAIASLTSSVAALSTQSSMVAKRGIGTAIVNSTSVSSDLYSADATRSFVGDDGLTYLGSWFMTNTNTVASAIGAQLSILAKIAGTNSLNPPTINLAPTGTGFVYIVDFAFVLTAGVDGPHHTQSLRVRVSTPVAPGANTQFAWGVASDFVTTTRQLDGTQTVSSTAFDIGVTRPSFELRLNSVVADPLVSLQRIEASLMYVADH